uniref:Uncharacterized protein n=1 Tax=Percolomonas cosmopolitus TaxID=63605 RepID=A0A7S1KLX6_9EUKA|mmetsp:Transcript_11464/g.43046  ORF Transcript_11464/g.43046 Transcript_11464/m.43046 type:complete len:229 (+) Transcript_11464:76-762(+)
MLDPSYISPHDPHQSPSQSIISHLKHENSQLRDDVSHYKQKYAKLYELFVTQKEETMYWMEKCERKENDQPDAAARSSLRRHGTHSNNEDSYYDATAAEHHGSSQTLPPRRDYYSQQPQIDVAQQNNNASGYARRNRNTYDIPSKIGSTSLPPIHSNNPQAHLRHSFHANQYDEDSRTSAVAFKQQQQRDYNLPPLRKSFDHSPNGRSEVKVSQPPGGVSSINLFGGY